MKATDVIKRDHEAAKNLFAQYDTASADEKRELEPKIFDALETHEAMEDSYFYPALKDAADTPEAFAELETEQQELAAEVEAAKEMSGDREEKITEIRDKVLAHAEKEEATVLPEAERLLSDDKLEELGAQMEPQSAAAKG